MSYNDYIPLDGAGALPANTEMDAMLQQQQLRGHQLEFQSTLEHRIKNIEEKLDALANILYQNREVLKVGMVPDLGAGHKPPTVKKSSFEDKIKQKEEQDRQIAEQGIDSLIPLETQQGMLKK
tara:strand:+ start:505 stop:873 length:369 start_codon:yes stop_codon:yes gene_type:complete